MNILLLLLPIIGAIVLIMTIIVFIQTIWKDKKHFFSWYMVGILTLILCITIYSFLTYINVILHNPCSIRFML
ncbi:hypothetical protein [Oceanobacillus limi]|uniref:hypothetical protein n=1 Tax=Oceanobacillus limi TaxID=930131 RepID=UPI000B889A94|nr:hypothetical protein [Oceanobacillus limi]